VKLYLYSPCIVCLNGITLPLRSHSVCIAYVAACCCFYDVIGLAMSLQAALKTLRLFLCYMFSSVRSCSACPFLVGKVTNSTMEVTRSLRELRNITMAALFDIWRSPATYLSAYLKQSVRICFECSRPDKCGENQVRIHIPRTECRVSNKAFENVAEYRHLRTPLAN
jgi:hypothetical protein